MAQNKEGNEKKAGVKIQDLSPKKDAKGGGGLKNQNLGGGELSGGSRSQNAGGGASQNSGGGASQNSAGRGTNQN